MCANSKYKQVSNFRLSASLYPTRFIIIFLKFENTQLMLSSKRVGVQADEIDQQWAPSVEEGPIELTELEGSTEERADGWPQGFLREQPVNLASIEADRCSGRGRHMQPTFETSNDDLLTHEDLLMATGSEQERSGEGHGGTEVRQRQLTPVEEGQSSPLTGMTSQEREQMGFGERMTLDAFWQANRKIVPDLESAGGHGLAEGGGSEEDTLGKVMHGALAQDGGHWHGHPQLLESSSGREAAPRVHLEMPLPEPESSAFSPAEVLNCDSWVHQQLSFQMPYQRDQETFEAEVSPLLRALSPDQLQQLEEKLNESEERLDQSEQDALADKLLIASSTHTKGPEQSGETSPALQQLGPGGSLPANRFKVAQASARQQQELAGIGGQVANGGLDQRRLEAANGNKPQSCDFRGSKSELAVIKPPSEYKSSMHMAGPTQHLRGLESGLQQEMSKTSSRHCGQRSEKLEGTIVRNLNQIVEPRRPQVGTSQGTEEPRRRENTGHSGAGGSSRDGPGGGSVTHILEKDHLRNIREEPLADGKRSLEDFQDLQQIEDGWIRSEESGASQQVWAYNGRLLSRAGTEKENDPGAAAHSATPTMSGGAEVHQASAQQDQAAFVFPDNSQSCSSRPIYYHESVIERSHDDDGDEARASPLCAVPSYSALDKSQSHAQTESVSRSIDHSAKQRRAPVAPRQPHPQLNPKSLNGSSRHSRADTDGFVLLRSSEHSVQKTGQLIGPRETSEHHPKQSQMLLDHVKSIVFEEVIERAREAKEAKDAPVAEMACSGSKEATAAGAAMSSINEFLTFAQKLSRSSNGKQQAMESQQRFVPKLAMMELPEAEGTGLRLRDEEMLLNGLATEDGAPVVEQQDEGSESEEEREGHTGSPTLSGMQAQAEVANRQGAQDLGGVLGSKNPRSSSLVNSLYLNMVHGSHSLQSSQKLVDAASSTQSFPRRAEASPGRVALLQCWADGGPAEQTPAGGRGNEVSYSWHTFNQNCGKQKAQQPEIDESKSHSATAQAQEEPPHDHMEAKSQLMQGKAELNQDLSDSPGQEGPSDQELYEASCSRNFKQSAHSLYSDEETALKSRWEQHQRNQQMRLRRHRNHPFAKNVGFRTTKDRGSAEEARTSQATSKTKSRNALHAEKVGQAKSSCSNVKVHGLRTADVSMELSAQFSRQGTLRPKNMTAMNCKNITKSTSSFALNAGLQRERSRISPLSHAAVEPTPQASDANHSVFNRNQKWQSRVQEKQRKLKQMLEQQEISKEREECRFKPKVIGFAYDNSGLTSKQKVFYKCEPRQGAAVKDKPVHQRCHEWQESREKKLVRREAQEKVREAKECTFKPKIAEYRPAPRSNLEPEPAASYRVEKDESRQQSLGSKGFIQRQTEWARSLYHKKSEQRSTVEKEQATEQTFRPKISRASQKIWWRRVASSQLAQEQRKQSAAPAYAVSIFVNQLMGADSSSRREESASNIDGRLKGRRGTADECRSMQRPRCKSAGALPRRRATRPPPAFPNHSDLSQRPRPLEMARPSQSLLSQYGRLRSWTNSHGRSCGPPGMECDEAPARAASHLDFAGSPLLLSHQRPVECDHQDVPGSRRPEYEHYVESSTHGQPLKEDVQRGAQEAEHPVATPLDQLQAPQNGHRGAQSEVPNFTSSVQPQGMHLEHSQPLPTGDRPIPGRIYKQMRSSDSQFPPKPTTPQNPPSSHEHDSKPSYYTEASQQIHEAIAHLQRISERYKAAEKAISQELAAEEAQAAAVTNDGAPPHHEQPHRLHPDFDRRLQQPSTESEAGPLWQAGGQPAARATKMKRLTRVRLNGTQGDFEHSTSSAAGSASLEQWNLDKENVERGAFLGSGHLGQIMEQKQAIIRNLRHKQRQQGVLIQKGSIGGPNDR